MKTITVFLIIYLAVVASNGFNIGVILFVPVFFFFLYLVAIIFFPKDLEIDGSETEV